MENKNKKKKIEQKSTQPEVCCPYFDEEKKLCVHPDCIRRLGFECKFSNRK